MQLLKIKIAANLLPLNENFEDNAIILIDKSENDILNYVEQTIHGKSYDSDKVNKLNDEVYGNFIKAYEKAESVIPTKFKNQTREILIRNIRRNFYYLWRVAEQIKIEFFKSEKVAMAFGNEKQNEDTGLKITTDANYYLYTYNGDSKNLTKQENPFKNITITIREINRVICADIYGLLEGLFYGTMKTEKNIESFDYYKLSGQSCKINLFSDLMKEYIPGRKFRSAIKEGVSTEKKNSEQLKMDCIEGSIYYIKDKIRNEIDVTIIPVFPEIIYDIVLKGKYNDDKTLFDSRVFSSQKENYDVLYDISHDNALEYSIMVKTRDGIVERSFIFNLKNINLEDCQEKWKSHSLEDIITEIQTRSKLSDDAVAKLLDHFDNEVRNAPLNKAINIVFALPAKQGYGIWMNQIKAAYINGEIKYWFLKSKYEPFEDASKTFFDGTR